MRWANSGLIIGPQRTVGWRVLDAQYFGVAQRRRRVFLVASARAGFDPRTVLFESEGLRRDTPPSREAEPPVAALTACGVGTCGADDNQATSGHIIANATGDGPVGTLDTECGYTQQAFQTVASGQVIGTITARMFNALGSRDVEEGALQPCIPIHDKATRHAGQTGRGSGNGLGVGQVGDPSPILTTGDKHAVAVSENQRAEITLNEITGALSSGGSKPGQGYPAVLRDLAVRRLTPTECERLQGFPDGHTDIPYKNKAAPDGPRYKAIGNSKAVPVVRWVGSRLLKELRK